MNYQNLKLNTKRGLLAKLLVITTTYSSAMATNQIQFIVAGDTGTGSDSQYQVSKAIESVCQQQNGCMFAVGLGDNIYEAGANSVDDQQFQNKFELPYSNLKIPFLMALGNHDQTLVGLGDGAAVWKGNYEVSYALNNIGKTKWIMPARYYYADALSNDGNTTARLVVYDSNPMRSYLLSPDPYFWPTGTYNQQQSSWVANALRESNATWRFVLAHHPVKGNSQEPWYQRLLFPWFKTQNTFVNNAVCGKSDFFFSGHVHDLEVLDDSENCSGTRHLISGAGAKSAEKPSANEYKSRYNSVATQLNGFFFVRLEGKKMEVIPYIVNARTGAPEQQDYMVYQK